jgi:hypothetical protein
MGFVDLQATYEIRDMNEALFMCDCIIWGIGLQVCLAVLELDT